MLYVVDSLARTARRYSNKRALSADEGGNAASFMENLAALVPLLYTGVLAPGVPEGKVGSVLDLIVYRISCPGVVARHGRVICWPSVWSCCHHLRRRIVHVVDRNSRSLCRQYVALAPLTQNTRRGYDNLCDNDASCVKQTPISLAWSRPCLVELYPDQLPSNRKRQRRYLTYGARTTRLRRTCWQDWAASYRRHERGKRTKVPILSLTYRLSTTYALRSTSTKQSFVPFLPLLTVRVRAKNHTEASTFSSVSDRQNESAHAPACRPNPARRFLVDAARTAECRPSSNAPRPPQSSQIPQPSKRAHRRACRCRRVRVHHSNTRTHKC